MALGAGAPSASVTDPVLVSREPLARGWRTDGDGKPYGHLSACRCVRSVIVLPVGGYLEEYEASR